MNAGSETRLLVAAPAETRREAQVDWYEVLVTPAAKSAHMLAFSQEAVEVARLDVQLVGDRRARMAMEDEQVRMTLEVSVERNASDLVGVRGTVNGQEFAFSGRAAESEPVHRTAEPRLDPAEARVLRRWGRLGDPLASLARATNARSTEPRHSWGCTACLLAAAGTGTLAGCCLVGQGGCCGGALLGAATVVGECGGDPCGH